MGSIMSSLLSEESGLLHICTVCCRFCLKYVNIYTSVDTCKERTDATLLAVAVSRWQTQREFFCGVLFSKCLMLNMHYFCNQEEVIKRIFKCGSKKSYQIVQYNRGSKSKSQGFHFQSCSSHLALLSLGVPVLKLNISSLFFLFSSYLWQVRNHIIKQ